MSSKCTRPVWSPGNPVPHACGGCIACRTRKVNEWKCRCIHEAAYWPHSSFVTLTYDNEHLPEGKTLDVKDVQKFYKRLRHVLEDENPPRKIKHLTSGEYGDPSLDRRVEGDRPHYHAIIFGIHPGETKLIKQAWGKGRIDIQPCNEATAAYVAGYIYKKLSRHIHHQFHGEKARAFQTSSNGIGMLHCLENWEQYKSHGYMTLKGVKYALPNFYKQVLGSDPRVRDQFIKEATAKQAAEYEARGLDYYSKEALELRASIRAQSERTIMAKMAIDEDRRALKKQRRRQGAA